MKDKKEQLEQISRYNHLIQSHVGKAVRPYRADGYVNMLNKYGTSRDSSETYSFVPEPDVPDSVLTEFYENNGLFAKIIDAPAEEAIKNGFELKGIKDDTIVQFYQSALDELDFDDICCQGIKWQRLFGGAIAVMLINDGRQLDEPLDWKHIKSIDDIVLYDRSVVQPDYQSVFHYDPHDPFNTRGSRLGSPEYYNVFSRFGNFRVHESRVLEFRNGKLPENSMYAMYQFWGLPEYIRIHRAIRDAEVAHGTASKLLDRSIQAVYKMKDLSSLLASQEGEDIVLRRMQIIDMARGLLSSMVIDSEGEDYNFQTFAFAGVADVIDSSCNFVSALSYVPQTILFGKPPQGMSGTDDSGLETWYSFVRRLQKRSIKPNLRYLLSVIFQAGIHTGEIEEVPNIDIEFNPLKVMSDTEQVAYEQQKAQVEFTKAQTAQLYIEQQVIDPQEVRAALGKAGEYDIETILDDESEEELFENDPSNQQETMPGTEGQASGTASVPAIYCPKGTKMLYMNEVVGADDEAQNEMLLQKGTAYRVTGIKRGNDGKIMVDAEVIGQAGNLNNSDAASGKTADYEEKTLHGDGGPGSGNFGHEGRPGEIGGSAPDGSADSMRSTEKTKKLKDSFKHLKPYQKYSYISRSGIIPKGEMASLREGVISENRTALNKLAEYERMYFDNAEYGRTVKTLDVEKRNEVAAMSDADAAAWAMKSMDRRLEPHEGWANPYSAAQKVAIDMGIHETPQVVSREDFDKYVKDSGAVVCYRGVNDIDSMTGENMQFQMAYNTQEPYFGDGIFGDGLYFSTKQSTAQSYAGRAEISTCAVRPDAKVLEYGSPEHAAAKKRVQTSDDSVAALCAGYDVIRKKKGDHEDYYIVLNRAALVMVDPVDALADGALKAAERNAARSDGNNEDYGEKTLDFSTPADTIKSKDITEDGAPIGNNNAAGPHKRSHLSSGDKAKYRNRIVGQKTSDGVQVKGFSDHAFDRIAQRNLSPKRIEDMLRSQTVSPDKTYQNRRCYDVKGSRLVLDFTTGTIITIEWRKQNR